MTGHGPGGDAAGAAIRRRVVASARHAHLCGPDAARRGMEQVVGLVLQHAAEAADLGICGTGELPAALAALKSAGCPHSTEDAARRTARAFTAAPADLLAAGAGDELALCGAVIILRDALAGLDTATR
ncbi:hypothetical protein [Amycolatopsis sp. NPDC004079]|uniref:hypothetical protein n=1 Tax=Amycolatopsis sp. NPDC004079 TaxID=3154549 RepID=UPI0033BB68DC